MSYEKVMQVKSRVIIGTKQTLKAMKNDEISSVFVAEDADPHIIQKVSRLAAQLEIPCERVASMEKLGNACGIDVGAAAVAVKKAGF